MSKLPPVWMGLCVWFWPAPQLWAANEQPLMEWNLTASNGLQGWQPNGDLTPATATADALSFYAKGADPILEYGPLLSLVVSPFQFVEIRLRADRDGTAELFWSNTSTGRFGGFTQEKTIRFAVRGDNAWHTYRLLPFWHAEGKLVRLRLDLYDKARFDLASIRILDSRPDEPASPRLKADFKTTPGQWIWFEPVNDGPSPLRLKSPQVPRCGAGFLLSPQLKVEAVENPFVSLCMAVNKGQRGAVYYASDRQGGWHSKTFAIIADGREHTYNIDMLDAPEWDGRILTIGLQPSEDTNATATLSSLQIADAPSGPPQLQFVSIGVEPAVARAGMPASIMAVISNAGGETASNVAAQIELSPGLELRQPSTRVQKLAALEFDQKEVLRWSVEARKPMVGSVRLTTRAANHPEVSTSAELTFTPRVSVPENGYVPEPRPVRGPFEVGAYYFPGWRTASQWQPLAGFPERKPVLGSYREGDPEVTDWHIKWAVEHGITFFAYDWYWSRGSRQLEHALHDGYFKARYRDLLKFCLLWANHNPPGTSSPEDCLNVTRFWIENYFLRPEYLKMQGKPIMIIFAPGRLRDDLGSEGVKHAFAAMRAECQSAGLPGLHLVACIGDAGGGRLAVEEGYDSLTAYNWPGLGLAGNAKQGSFATLIEGYRRQWEHLIEAYGAKLNPLPISGGWDSRPWHGENNLVRFGRTPELFKKHLMEGCQVLKRDTYKETPTRMLLVEAWNEWGEGSYIEPHAEFGFGYLDALREVVTDAPGAHDDITPQDAGLGPYDVPVSLPAATDWDFSAPGDAWMNTMHMTGVRVGNGVISGSSTGDDPAFFGPPIQARAAQFAALHLRLRLTESNHPATAASAQFFWQTARQPESESSSIRFQTQVDGQWHDYIVPLSNHARWRGVITRLRLDPADHPGVLIELDRIALAKTRRLGED